MNDFSKINRPSLFNVFLRALGGVLLQLVGMAIAGCIVFGIMHLVYANSENISQYWPHFFIGLSVVIFFAYVIHNMIEIRERDDNRMMAEARRNADATGEYRK
jgi:TRAP-type C4-dicarboxylate transport system permease small subunit